MGMLSYLKEVSKNIFQWATGDGTYHTLAMCMAYDWFWIGAVIVGSIAVGTAYLAIARLAFVEYRKKVRESAEAKLLMDFMIIFLLCALSGYFFYVIKFWVPLYRVLALVLAVLSVISWRFYFRAKKSKFFGKIIHDVEVSHLKKLRELEQKMSDHEITLKGKELDDER